MLKKNIKSLLATLPVVAVVAMPMVASAQSGSVQEIIGTFTNIINLLLPFVISLAVLWFLWGVLQFVTAGGDEEKRGQGRDTMIYGVIAIFVMVSLWGLVGILDGTFGTAEDAPFEAPDLPTN